MAAIQYLTIDHLSTKDLIRIFSKVTINLAISYGGTPCWLWIAGTDGDGYAITSLKRQGHPTLKAHRLIYAWLVEPIPKGNSRCGIDHLCRRRNCINPLHLEHVSTKINVLRGDTIQAKNAAKTHCVHGHPLSGNNLYVQITPKGPHRYCKTCSNLRTQAYYKRQGGQRKCRLKRLNA